MSDTWHMHSDAIGQDTVVTELVQDTAYEIRCADGTVYGPNEIKRLCATQQSCPRSIPVQVHLIKKMFAGEIVFAGVPPQPQMPLFLQNWRKK